MRRALVPIIRAFAQDERGAVLLIFTIFLVPLLTVVAVSVDLGRILVVKQKLTNAIDAAAIAVGRHPELGATEARAMADAFIRANYPNAEIGDLLSFDVVPTATQVDVTAVARVPTTFLKVIQYDYVDVRVSSQVLRQQRKAEVVMVLDNSGSMAGTKLNNLKAAANKLVDILFGTDTVSDHVKIGLVPFTAAVNIGARVGSGWLDETGLSLLQGEDIDLGGRTLLGLFSQLTGFNHSWTGCVRARSGPGEYDLTDVPPDPAVGETLFVPYFAPDEPDSPGGYTNNYLLDLLNPSPNDPVRRQRSVTKYLGAVLANLGGSPPRGPNYNCVLSAVQPLTDTKSTITTAIAVMQAAGNTVIPEGLAWGWRVLSPGEPFTEGAPYSDQSVVKVLILLTDGENNVGGGGNGHNHSAYSAYGYAASGHLGATDGSQTRQVLDRKTATLCSNIKSDKDGVGNDQDIYIYTISFQVPDGVTRAMLEACATPAARCPGGQCYYESPTTTSLEGIFSSIALGINELRVAR